jgi:hypothetical protein
MPIGLQLIAKGSTTSAWSRITCAAERVLGTPRERLGAPPMCERRLLGSK